MPRRTRLLRRVELTLYWTASEVASNLFPLGRGGFVVPLTGESDENINADQTRLAIAGIARLRDHWMPKGEHESDELSRAGCDEEGRCAVVRVARSFVLLITQGVTR